MDVTNDKSSVFAGVFGVRDAMRRSLGRIFIVSRRFAVDFVSCFPVADVGREDGILDR